MKPAFDESGRFLWIAPMLLFLGLVAGAWIFLRNRRQTELPPVTPLSEEDRARITAAEAAEKENELKGGKQ